MLTIIPSRPQRRFDGLVSEGNAVGVLFTVALLKSFGVLTATPTVTRTSRGTIDVEYQFGGPTRLVDNPMGVHAGVLDGVLINSIVSGIDCVYAVTEGDERHRRVVIWPYQPVDGDDNAISKTGDVQRNKDPSYLDLLTEGELYEQYEQLRRQVKSARAKRAEAFSLDLRPHLTDKEYAEALAYEESWTQFERKFFRTLPGPAKLSVRSMLMWGDGRTVDVNPEVRRQHVLRMLTVRPFFPHTFNHAVGMYQNRSAYFNNVERNIQRTRTDDPRVLNNSLNLAINMIEGLPIKQTLFRREREAFPDDIKVGDVFYKNNVTSTTVTPKLGQFGTVMMIIEVPAGFPTLATLTVGSQMHSEAEIMLPAGCAYVVLEKHKGPDILGVMEWQVHSLEELDRKIAGYTGSLRARLDRVRARMAHVTKQDWRADLLMDAVRAEWAPRADARVHTMATDYSELILLRVISAPTIQRRFPPLSYPPVRSEARAREIADLVDEAVMEQRAEAFNLPVDLMAALAEPSLGEFRAMSAADIRWMTLMRHLPLHTWTALQHLSTEGLSPQVLRVAKAGAAWGILGRVSDDFLRTDSEDTMSLADVIGIVEEHWDTRADPLTSPMAGRWTLEAAYEDAIRAHPGQIPRRYEGHVRVMTYNVHEFANPRTLDVISAADPDILLLQEATADSRIFSELMSRLNYPHRKMCVGWSDFGNILCTRLDVLSDPESMDLPRGPRENRCAVRVKVQLPNGPPLWVIVTHLDVFDESGDARDRQAKYLVDTWVEPAVRNGEEVLLAGDMNEVYLPEMLVSRAELLRAAHRNRTRKELSTRAISHFRRHLFDVFDASGTPPPPFTVWSLTRVDHMLVTPRIACRVVMASAPLVEGSDHVPIIVDLESGDVKREESKGSRVFLEREQIWMDTAADGTRRYSLREDGYYLAPPAQDFTMRFLRRENVWVATRGTKTYALGEDGETWKVYRKKP